VTTFAIPLPGETMYFGERGAPAVIVIHDWFGRLPWLEDVAAAIAAEGFLVAVPDFYGGLATTDSETAADLMETLDLDQVMGLLDQLVVDTRASGSKAVGEVGFSFGGWMALFHAQSGAVDAVVAYYAGLLERHHNIIPCPVLLQHAEVDGWELGGAPGEFVNRLAEHGTPVTHFSYLATEHHFANMNIPAHADGRAAALALARTRAFLSRHLQD
jgi:carboxymethylenebutenolidase